MLLHLHTVPWVNSAYWSNWGNGINRLAKLIGFQCDFTKKYLHRDLFITEHSVASNQQKFVDVNILITVIYRSLNVDCTFN